MAREKGGKELAVEVSSLVFSYGEHRALDDFSVQVEPQKIFGFLGPNGGGKTTLFRILATLARPHSGRVRMFGVDAVAEPAWIRRSIGVVFQNPSLDLELTAEENLRHQGHLYGLRGRTLTERIEAGLSGFELLDRRRHKAKTLSGGLRRRLEIAKALLHKPKLLLLDEPSSGLDPAARRSLWTILAALRRHGVTVLLTTHFMEEADRCDQLAVLDRGRKIVEGRPSELKGRLGGDVVRLATQDPAGLAQALLEEFPGELAPTIANETVQFGYRGAHQLVPRLAAALPGRIDALTVAKPSLEDVFLHFAGHSFHGQGEE